VVEADGKPVTSAKDLVAIIHTKKPGDTVVLRLEPFGPGPARTVRAKVVERPGSPGQPLLGVTLEDRPEYTFPFKVEIDSEQVGGPSAGLAFTLSILDRLTPGDLTGGHKVAVTGTINLDSTVGPVGGVRQKTEAAINAGATLFIVPPDEYHDATDQARGRIKIRKASTLDEALTVLHEIGGDPVPKVPHPTESD
jgi:PDZ domain-containing protein